MFRAEIVSSWSRRLDLRDRFPDFTDCLVLFSVHILRFVSLFDHIALRRGDRDGVTGDRIHQALNLDNTCHVNLILSSANSKHTPFDDDVNENLL